jgi:hypothetical protein
MPLPRVVPRNEAARRHDFILVITEVDELRREGSPIVAEEQFELLNAVKLVLI